MKIEYKAVLYLIEKIVGFGNTIRIGVFLSQVNKTDTQDISQLKVIP